MNPDTQKLDVQSMREVNIYLGSFLEKLEELKNTQTKTNEKLDNLGSSFVTHIEFDPIKKQHEKNTIDISDFKEWRDGLMGKLIGAGMVVGAVFAIISLIINHYWK